ncbi:hypothetical protein TrST_g4997 [Triparma strigata]|uniref:MOSC domain-containing protein n=1 Tax=Triparma strigata TaxID=1606541 RepID=A0A9W7AVD5_9STRA|nr:hypothetical protein TrST_g4997 [Triparma strigata]
MSDFLYTGLYTTLSSVLSSVPVTLIIPLQVIILLITILITLHLLFPPTLLVESLHIYPIKSAAGIQVDSLTLTSKGVKNDRQYVVLQRPKDDPNGWEVVTQRENPRLALLQPKLHEDDSVSVTYSSDPFSFDLTFDPSSEKFKVELFRCFITCSIVPGSSSFLLRHFPSKSYSIAYVHVGRDSTLDSKWSDCYLPSESSGAVDGSQLLLTFTRSLSTLNSSISSPAVKMSNFRPNVVVSSSGFLPSLMKWEDDHLRSLSLSLVKIRVNKLCHRCVLSTVIQDVGEFDRRLEPLKSLRKIRYLKDGRFGDRPGNSPGFGVNCSLRGEGGVVKVGDGGRGEWGWTKRCNWRNVSGN